MRRRRRRWRRRRPFNGNRVRDVTATDVDSAARTVRVILILYTGTRTRRFRKRSSGFLPFGEGKGILRAQRLRTHNAGARYARTIESTETTARRRPGVVAPKTIEKRVARTVFGRKTGANPARSRSARSFSLAFGEKKKKEIARGNSNRRACCDDQMSPLFFCSQYSLSNENV